VLVACRSLKNNERSAKNFAGTEIHEKSNIHQHEYLPEIALLGPGSGRNGGAFK
jgi:hypothetical protein